MSDSTDEDETLNDETLNDETLNDVDDSLAPVPDGPISAEKLAALFDVITKNHQENITARQIYLGYDELRFVKSCRDAMRGARDSIVADDEMVGSTKVFVKNVVVGVLRGLLLNRSIYDKWYIPHRQCYDYVVELVSLYFEKGWWADVIDVIPTLFIATDNIIHFYDRSIGAPARAPMGIVWRDEVLQPNNRIDGIMRSFFAMLTNPNRDLSFKPSFQIISGYISIAGYCKKCNNDLASYVFSSLIPYFSSKYFDEDTDQATTDNGATPLYITSQNGHHPVVEALLQHGAAVDEARTDNGETPLYIASQ